MADDEDILCADGVPHDLHILRRLIFCIILPEMLWLLCVVFFYFYSYYSVYTIFTLDDKQSFSLLWSCKLGGVSVLIRYSLGTTWSIRASPAPPVVPCPNSCIATLAKIIRSLISFILYIPLLFQ